MRVLIGGWGGFTSWCPNQELALDWRELSVGKPMLTKFSVPPPPAARGARAWPSWPSWPSWCLAVILLGRHGLRCPGLAVMAVIVPGFGRHGRDVAQVRPSWPIWCPPWPS